jgi:2-oxoisovalerate dehydrogenase E2 component (dihydrolipoyl transacylase)
MTEYVFKLPDLGEGTVEAEIVAWHVHVGDQVREGDIIADVMTDKANVEVPAPVDGRVLRTSGQPGDLVAVGSELIALEISQTATAVATVDRDGRRAAEADPPSPAAARQVLASVLEPVLEPVPEPVLEPVSQPEPTPEPATLTRHVAGAAVITSPAIRRRAKEAGMDLRQVSGSGPRGRILRRDVEAALASTPGAAAAATPGEAGSGEAGSGEEGGDEFDAIRVIGTRRVIAERMAQSKREIPHFSYVEEVDVSELERLRRHLNERFQRRLSVLPFIALGLIRALEDFPQCNARFDGAGLLQRWRPVHLGVATQTREGLKVPVIRQAQRHDLWTLADAIATAAEAARTGAARAADLTGSTITLTSLGALGGIVSTPVINYPEVAIVGVNKVVDRPMVVDGQVGIRAMMNLSSSFDHRFVDGFDAAAMIQRLKSLLEQPATLFIGDPRA